MSDHRTGVRTQQVNVRLDILLYHKIDTEAHRKGLSKAEVVRDILEEHFKHYFDSTIPCLRTLRR